MAVEIAFGLAVVVLALNYFTRNLPPERGPAWGVQDMDD